MQGSKPRCHMILGEQTRRPSGRNLRTRRLQFREQHSNPDSRPCTTTRCEELDYVTICCMWGLCSPNSASPRHRKKLCHMVSIPPIVLQNHHRLHCDIELLWWGTGDMDRWCISTVVRAQRGGWLTFSLVSKVVELCMACPSAETWEMIISTCTECERLDVREFDTICAIIIVWSLSIWSLSVSRFGGDNEGNTPKNLQRVFHCWKKRTRKSVWQSSYTGVVLFEQKIYTQTQTNTSSKEDKEQSKQNVRNFLFSKELLKPWQATYIFCWQLTASGLWTTQETRVTSNALVGR